MPVHELLELGRASASGNAIQAWKALGSQQPVFQVWVAHFPELEEPWQASAGDLPYSSVSRQAPGWCRFWTGYFLSQFSEVQTRMERITCFEDEVPSIPRSN